MRIFQLRRPLRSPRLLAAPAQAAGDLSRQTPIEITVDLGKPGKHVFEPSKLRFETGKLYKLILRNPSKDPHYFTSHGFSQLIFTRKVQVTQERDGKTVTLAEFKGAIREIEVYPGHAAEWWFVPVATGRVTDLQCGHPRQRRQDACRSRHDRRDRDRITFRSADCGLDPAIDLPRSKRRRVHARKHAATCLRGQHGITAPAGRGGQRAA